MLPKARNLGVRLLLCALLAAAHRGSRAAARAVPAAFEVRGVARPGVDCLSDPYFYGAHDIPPATFHTPYRHSARATCLCKWPPPPCSAPYNTWLPPSCVQAAAVQPAAPLPDWAKRLDREGPSRDESFAYIEAGPLLCMGDSLTIKLPGATRSR